MVWALLDADVTLADESKYAVLAALESDIALAQHLDGTASPVAPASAADTSADVDPAGAFLESIDVAGFRGIGPRTRLDLQPGPGITVVSGRNGSGKSSFAEALEYALTRDSYRWRNRSTVWTDTWRNLHNSTPCEIRVGLTVEGGEPTVIGVDWPADGGLDAGNVWTQVRGKPRVDGLATLGWSRSIQLHRPLLTYEEIGGLLVDTPSVLYDALAQLLGLEEIKDAEKRLNDAAKEAKGPRTKADSAVRPLRDRLAASGDPRATNVVKALRRPYKLEIVEAAITHGDGDKSGVRARLQAVLDATVPTDAEVTAAATAIDDAEAAVAALADVALEVMAARTDLLRRAIDYRDLVDGDACPVCESSVLDDDWRQRTSAAIETATQNLAEYRQRKADLAEAHRRGKALLAGLVDIEPVEGVDPGLVDAYRTAVAAAHALPAELRSLAAHIRVVMPPVSAALGPIKENARTAIETQEDAWRPIALDLAAWHAAERAAQQSDDLLATVTAAKTWMTSNALKLRNQRLEPIAAQAREIWSQLRQESNVDIGSITLQGSATRRHAAFEGAVDGQPVGALSVMSQGELHALALALFLPRATTPASPFRFIVLDDPIQAMDPAKIDGFLKVLAGLAKTRQVIVFSHDDRLATAIRTTSVDARLVEVTRESGSRVVIKESMSPALRYVEDVFAVVADDNVPDDVKRRAAPALFRQAVEAAAQQSFFASSYRKGLSRSETEDLWNAAKRTRACIALAVEGDSSHDLSGWLSQRGWRRPTLNVCNGTHGGAAAPDRATVRDLRRTVEELLAT